MTVYATAVPAAGDPAAAAAEEEDVPVLDCGLLPLAWRGLGFDAPNGRRVLSDACGYVDPGELCFIMGPSGAGKSSLLDAIADRVARPLSGGVALGGVMASLPGARRKVRYVQQTDVLNPVQTVRQALELSARLCTTSSDDVGRRVNEALTVLGLTEQADTKVGGVLVRGLSGGQKRRLSVGVELVTEPHLLLLDEPTSGLDSASTHKVVEALRDIARSRNIAVVCTIHQPSELVFQMSDKLVLLSAGRTAYFGSTATAVDYFEALCGPIPARTSSAEWMLNLLDTSFRPSAQVEPLLEAWVSSAENKVLTKKLDHCAAIVQSNRPDPSAPLYPVGFARQVSVLAGRQLLNMALNPMAIWLRFAMYVALSVMIGTVWIDIGDSADNIQDVINALFFIAAFMVFMSISVLPAFLEEKEIFVRERANMAYPVLAYNVAHLIVDTPFLGLLAFVCGTICFWSVGFDDDANSYGLFILNLFLSFMVAESMMLLIASVVPVFIVGIAVGAFAFGASMVMQGFFIKVEEIGWYWRWMHYISLHTYSFSALMYVQFHDRVFPCGSGTMWACTGGYVDGDDVLKMYDFDDTNVALNLVILAVMTLVYRSLAAAWMYKYHTGKK